MRYRLYIDESGDHTYRHLEDPSRRFLGLTGVFIEAEYYRNTLQLDLEQLKQRHFPYSPDEPIVLHRKDILYKKGPFWRLRDKAKEQAFNEDFLQFLKNHNYTVITVVIDKKVHIERYGSSAYHPYHYCLVALLERYCGFLNFANAQGDVMAEKRGGTEDEQLKEAYRTVYRSGTFYRGPSFFSGVLTSKELKLKPKIANIAGLQISDLLAYPCKEDVLIDLKKIVDPAHTFGREISQCILPKYNRQVYQGRI